MRSDFCCLVELIKTNQKTVDVALQMRNSFRGCCWVHSSSVLQIMRSKICQYNLPSVDLDNPSTEEDVCFNDQVGIEIHDSRDCAQC